MRQYFILLLLLLITTIVFSEDSLYPTTVSELTTTITLGGNGGIEGLKNGEEVNFQTLTFQESPYQTINSVNEELVINNKVIKPTYTLDEYGNKYVNFKITENGNFSYAVTANITTKSLIYNINDYELTRDINTQLLYTNSSDKIESNSTEILTLSKNKLYKNSYIETVNDAVFWTNDYVEYATGSDFQKYYLLQRSAIETLIDKKGVCDEFANLAAGILRAKGIPTRINIGVTYDGQKWGNHAWIGTYHKDVGWVPSDPTFRESGFVDATHIKLASFLDETESNAKATYPSTAKVTINSPENPVVTVIDKKYFNVVTINAQIDKLKANEWNSFTTTVKNNTNSTITAPISIKQNYKDILIEEKSKAVILEPGEKKTVDFEIYPNIVLESNQTASGELTINSLTTPYTTKITIEPHNSLDNGETIVQDITPIATTNNIKIQIKASNYSSNKKLIDINISDNNKTYSSTEELEEFSTRTIEKIVPLNNDGYLVTITTPTEVVTQKIYLEKQKITIIPTTTKTTTVVQKVDIPTQKDTLEALKDNPEIAIIAALMGIVTILLGIFLVRKQYV